MNDFLKEIVTCKGCGKQEYYGDMHWGIHGQVCRACIYREWEMKDPNFSALGMPTFSNEKVDFIHDTPELMEGNDES